MSKIYHDSYELFGIESKQIPCDTGEGAPTTATVGAVGCFYMDTLPGDVYKCVSAVDGVYVWERMGEGVDTLIAEFDLKISETSGILRLTQPDTSTQVEYLGLNTSALVNYCLKLTPDDNSTASRLYYKIPVKKGDTITISATDYWTSALFYYEPVECEADTHVLTTPGFQPAQGSVSFTIENEKTTQVFIGIRYGQYYEVKVPSAWGVVDNQFDKAFDVRKIARSIYSGRELEVKNDGRICAKSTTPKAMTPWQNVAHRGYPNGMRENTIPSFYEALKDGCMMVECDIHLTSDGVAVLCHDATISGTVNGESATMTIADSTYEQLSTLLLSDLQPYGSITIPKLEDALKFLKHYGMMATIDFKNISDDCLTETVRLVRKYNMQDSVIYFTAFNAVSVLGKVLEIDKNARLVFYYSEDMGYIEDITTDPNRIVIALQTTELSDASVMSIRNKHYTMYCWGVTKNTYETAFSYYPDFVEYTTGTVVSDITQQYLLNTHFW